MNILFSFLLCCLWLTSLQAAPLIKASTYGQYYSQELLQDLHEWKNSGIRISNTLLEKVIAPSISHESFNSRMEVYNHLLPLAQGIHTVLQKASAYAIDAHKSITLSAYRDQLVMLIQEAEAFINRGIDKLMEHSFLPIKSTGIPEFRDAFLRASQMLKEKLSQERF